MLFFCVFSFSWYFCAKGERNRCRWLSVSTFMALCSLSLYLGASFLIIIMIFDENSFGNMVNIVVSLHLQCSSHHAVCLHCRWDGRDDDSQWNQLKISHFAQRNLITREWKKRRAQEKRRKRIVCSLFCSLVEFYICSHDLCCFSLSFSLFSFLY